METFPIQETVDEQPSQRTCSNCGSYVTKRFVRVFGANDGSVYGCMNCSTGRELREGGGTRP